MGGFPALLHEGLAQLSGSETLAGRPTVVPFCGPFPRGTPNRDLGGVCDLQDVTVYSWLGLSLKAGGEIAPTAIKTFSTAV